MEVSVRWSAKNTSKIPFLRTSGKKQKRRNRKSSRTLLSDWRDETNIQSKPSKGLSKPQTRAIPTSEKKKKKHGEHRAQEQADGYGVRMAGRGRGRGDRHAWRMFLAGWVLGNGEPEQRRANLWELLALDHTARGGA